jgi:uncharacterized membrane protein/protein-disulfide isomerase
MSRRAASFALLCALVGLGASAAAAYTHYHRLYDPSYRSFCDVNETISCTQVYASRFSTFQGVPVALFGGLWFVVAGLISIAGLTARPSVRDSVPGYLFALSTLALAVVLYMAYASFVVLNVICPLCLTTYAAVIGLFLVAGAATSFPMTTLPRRAAADFRVFIASPLAIALAVLFLAGAATTLAFFPREGVTGDALPAPTQDQQGELERFMATAPRAPLNIPAEGAKVLVVKFNDYQCPACGQSYLQYRPILAKYEASNPGQVRMVLKDYPLNPTCNSHLTTMLHPAACDAAVAVRLARQHSRGEAMEEWFYTHQAQLTPPSVRQAVKEIGEVTDFDAKYAAALELVKSDIELSYQVHVSQTPTFFVNGVKLDGMIAPQYFDKMIAYELQHAPK